MVDRLYTCAGGIPTNLLYSVTARRRVRTKGLRDVGVRTYIIYGYDVGKRCSSHFRFREKITEDESTSRCYESSSGASAESRAEGVSRKDQGAH